MTVKDAGRKLVELNEALTRVARVARVNANAAAPAGMVATYVEIEVWHALGSHGGDAQRCDSCHELLGR